MSNIIVCQICKKEFDLSKGHRGISHHICYYHGSLKEYYDKYLKRDCEGYCYCGKETKFLGLRGYTKYCCYSCSSKSLETRSKKIESYLNKYGVINPSQSGAIREKIKRTYIKNYGVDNYSKTDESRKNKRIRIIENIENRIKDGQASQPFIGKQEPEFFKQLQKHTQFKIILQDQSFKSVIGRFPDGHIPELKLFIQFDERAHFIDYECTRYREDDIRCTKDLESISGYRVFRVSEKQWKENREIVFGDFKKLIGGLT